MLTRARACANLPMIPNSAKVQDSVYLFQPLQTTCVAH